MDPLEGEATTDNNRRAFVQKVLRDKVRVLHVAGRPEEQSSLGSSQHTPFTARVRSLSSWVPPVQGGGGGGGAVASLAYPISAAAPMSSSQVRGRAIVGARAPTASS